MKLFSATLLIGLGLILVAFLTYAFYPMPDRESEAILRGEPAGAALRAKQTFAWSFRSFEIDGIPRTAISLTARDIAGASSVTKDIDEIEGGCNDYPEPDADLYQYSTMIICYYAGLGRYYKVVESGTGFAVMRLVFEEAGPDYDPPIQQYEVIERF